MDDSSLSLDIYAAMLRSFYKTYRIGSTGSLVVIITALYITVGSCMHACCDNSYKT